METVLIPVTSHTGWARDVVTTAAEIESGNDVEAVVVHVFEEGEVESTRSNLDLPAGETATLDELATRKSGVLVTMELLEEERIDARVNGVRAENKPGSPIITIAEQEDADRIYLYSRKRSPAGKAVFGSRVQRVLLNASCPVVVVPFGAR
jgi:nucleotide-binding universal stress UspA family protein